MAKSQNTTTKKKKAKKRHSVGVGDFVSFYSPIAHMSGSLGEVMAVLDQDRVVIKGAGAEYESYEGMWLVVLTYKPSGQTKQGDMQETVKPWIRKVIIRKTAQPPKPKKPKKPPVVITGTDELIKVLTDDDASHSAVHFVPDDNAGDKS